MNQEQFTKLISIFLSSSIQAQIFHRQTKSFSEHMTLGNYYDEIIELIDGLTESFQGKYDIVTDYSSFAYVNYVGLAEVIAYFEELAHQLTMLRTSVPDSFLQNQIDGIEELVYSTLYKLRFLK